jgi:hypothetical protein
MLKKNYIFKKKKKRKNIFFLKKEEVQKLGWPWPKWGDPTTPFWPMGWLEPPLRLVWGWFNHPHGQGGGPTTPKRPKKRER